MTTLNGLDRFVDRPVEKRPHFEALGDLTFSLEPEVLGTSGSNGGGIANPVVGATAVRRGKGSSPIDVGARFVCDFADHESRDSEETCE